MSSIAAAKKRRAGIQPNAQEPQIPSKPASTSSAPLSIAQVFASIDTRLIHLETTMIDHKLSNQNQKTAQEEPESASTIFAEYIEDMNQKFDILAEEITNTKDLLLKLQTFTMEVNKMLVDNNVNAATVATVSVTNNIEPEPEPQPIFISNKPIKEKKNNTEKKVVVIEPSIILKYNPEIIESGSSSSV